VHVAVTSPRTQPTDAITTEILQLRDIVTQFVSSTQSQHESMRDSSIQRLTKELSEIKDVLQEKTTTIRTLKESLEEYKDSQDKLHRQINDIKARMDQSEQQNSLLGRVAN